MGLVHPNKAPLGPNDEYSASLPREGLAFHQVQQTIFERERARMNRDVEGQTLDLSMPKKRDNKDQLAPPSAQGPPYGHSPSPYPPPAHSKTSKEQQQQQQQQQQHYRGPPTSVDPMTGYPAGMRAPAPYPPRSTPPTQNSSRPSGGSIMQGTPLVASPSANSLPVLQVPRTDGLIRPAVQSRDSLTGSITQGTPIIVKDLDARSGPPSGAHSSHPAYEAYRGMPTPQQPGPPPRMQYQPDPQSYSRQIILSSDYLLSQQMMDRNSGQRRDMMPLQPQIQATSRPSDRPPPPPSHTAYPRRPPSPMYVQKLPYGMDSHHGYPPHSSGGGVAPQHQQQPPPQQPTPPQQQQQRQGVIQRNSSVPSVRQPDPRPSPPAPSPHQQQSSQGRTSSPAGGLLTVGPGGGGLHSSRPNSIAGAPPVSISPRGDSIYVHDAFASLVNAAAAQPSLPVPDRDRRDREREKERDPRGGLHHPQPTPVSR